MGTWGYGNFENDTALDWLADFEAQPTIEFLEATIDQTLEEDYIDSEVSMNSLAAIEVIAASRHKPSTDFPELDQALITNLSGKVSDTLIQKCLLTIERLLDPEDNELYELWADVDKQDQYVNVQEELVKRLY